MEVSVEQETTATSILRKHYSTLHDVITSPNEVALKLYSERILADEEYDKLEST